MDRTFTVSEIKSLIRESSKEFKAKMGTDVETQNKKINNDAYKEANNRAKSFNGQDLQNSTAKNTPYIKDDNNGTLLDYQTENNNDSYKKRIKAQAEGYTSEMEKENGIDKVGDFSDNKKFYNAVKKSGQEMHQIKKDLAKSGLQARKWPDKIFNDNKNEMYESKIKTAIFKKTEFLTEGHMISKIPDEFKKDGEVFKMIDKTNNTYLLEWRDNKPKIIGHMNENGLNESIERMKSLFDYNSSEYVNGLNNKERKLEEENGIGTSLNIIRNIEKK